MAGEPILIVDDTPVNLKLTRILLINEGYQVVTAASAEEALEALKQFRPEMVLTDIQLPGMDGFELTRLLKSSPETRDILVVALTAFAMKGDEQKALDAGCDGYITKPIDTRALGSRIREILARRGAPPPGAAKLLLPRESIPTAEMQSLRQRFIAEGLEYCGRWLRDLDQRFDTVAAERTVHQWIGAGGLLGYGAISRLSREVNNLLKERPVDSGQLRESLANLAQAFANPQDASELPAPESIVQSLSGKRVTLVGFHTPASERLGVALDRARAIQVPFDGSLPPASETLPACDLVVLDAGSPAAAALRPGSFLLKRPVVLAGTREDVLALDAGVQTLTRECLMDPWDIDEALLRLSLALARRQQPARGPAGGASLKGETAVRPKVLIADNDPTVMATACASIQTFGMDCQTVSDGPGAVAAIRRDLPAVAVLDGNMPGMDGYEVLETVRAETLPVRVLLLTARPEEQDILRGFTLGADDYLVKPFNPIELVARLRRLLG